MIGTVESLTENERHALRAVRQGRARTQTALTAELDIAQQSGSRIVASLAGKQLLDIGEPVSEGRRGKPSPALALKADASYAIGVSIMSDAVATGLIDFSGTILGREIIAPSSMQPEQVLCCVERQIGDLLAKRGVEPAALCGVGIAMSGYFMDDRGSMNPPAPLKDWLGIDIAGLFADRLGIPAWVDNDGNAAAVGEAALGVGRHFRSFAYLFFSSGFGGGVIVDGKPLVGRFGNSGEFAGILPYNLYAHPNLELLRRCVVQRGVDVASVHDLVTRFEPDWPGVEDWIAKTRDSLNLVASACSAILDPEAIVLGGLLPRPLAERLIEEIEFFSQPRWGTRRPVPRVVPAEAPGDAALFGAASLPLERIYF